MGGSKAGHGLTRFDEIAFPERSRNCRGFPRNHPFGAQKRIESPSLICVRSRFPDSSAVRMFWNVR